MIVVDASALGDALARDGERGAQARSELAKDQHWVAPQHLIVETFSCVRGLLLGGKITNQRAWDAVEALGRVAVDTVSSQPLLPRMWELCGRLSGYDAAFVAAAEAHDCPLVTADGRLVRAGGLRCELRLTMPAG